MDRLRWPEGRRDGTVTPERAKRIPVTVAGVDIRSLPLEPRDAFVLSRVDGVSTTADILAATGLDAAGVEAALDRLAVLGAIRWDGADGSDGPPIASEPPEDNSVDLDAERRHLILETYASLQTSSHYQLLGVPKDADRKAVKASYYKVVNVFHPDRYYGKNLGSYKHKLEVIFDRLTEAQEVLSSAQGRAEYDAYLERQRKTQDMERLLADDSQEAQLRRVKQQIDLEAYAESTRSSEARPQPFSQAPTRRPPVQSPLVPPSVEVQISDAPSSRSGSAMRRLSLARKLLGTTGSSMRPQRTTPVVVQERTSSGSNELKRLFDERATKARNSQVELLKKTAEEQYAGKNYVAAMNSLRLASSLAPDNQDIGTLLIEVQGRAAAELADTYLQQAQYEEKAGRLAEAAKSYERVANAKPSAFACERAARCLLEAGGDLKAAADLAKRAVSLAPDSADPRLTLGRVYLAAGMKSSAIGELERASGLAPSDANIRNWLVRARGGKS